ncbi:LysR substrate-binding domain-containing protein [Halomonas nitroreducens]|uniref:LysR family transcriptional regulator n=1 Tax=Halomonas nitroreducens TaxID=447425 RepID=A0A3S0HS78_9GAMM|nr:LysR substrate-binding domain-containing protein [Halomonas nitroreducens]RTR01471.1 LysR family transcriptional regulator [Halomonas nitroreducens]
MAKLTYRQIEAFRAVMISGTTSGAADILCVSQPAISRLLADFEETVGVTMFERRRRRLHPTPEARFFFEEVERAFVSLEQLSRAAEELREFHLGSLRVASMPAASVEFLPALADRFSQAHPGVSVTLQVRSTQQVVDLVASQQFDLGVISGIALDDPAVEERTLADSRLVCALPPGHPLSEREVVRPADLEGEVFVSLGSEQSIRHTIDGVFENAGVKRQLLIDTQLHYAACAFVLAGSGVSLVDPITAWHYRRLGLVVKRFEPRVAYRYSVIFPRQRGQSGLTKSFLGLLGEALDDLQAESRGLFERVGR